MKAEQVIDMIAADVVKMGRIQAVKMHVATLINWRKEYYLDPNETFIGDSNAVDALIKDVARVFNVKVNNIKSRSKSNELVMLRKIVVFISTTYRYSSLTDIGKKLGGRDHTTLIHSNHSFRDLYHSNDMYFLSYWNKYLREGADVFTHNIIGMIKDGSLPLHKPDRAPNKFDRSRFTTYSNSTPFGIANEVRQVV